MLSIYFFWDPGALGRSLVLSVRMYRAHASVGGKLPEIGNLNENDYILLSLPSQSIRSAALWAVAKVRWRLAHVHLQAPSQGRPDGCHPLRLET
jgi:hypothetical protein